MARRRLAQIFRDAGLPEPDLDARVLLCAAGGIDHAGLIREPDAPLGPVAASTLAAYADARLGRAPVSRILGSREFWGLRFVIGPAVLDPRPETEGLVGSLLDAIGGRCDQELSILDLGTGSGAILCALMSELPAARGVGIDRSREACAIAQMNVDALNLASRAKIMCVDWDNTPTERFDLIACNPPYIPSAEIASLEPEVRGFDPIQALDGGLDGLDPYRSLIPRIPALLSPSGVVGFECGYDQGDRVAALIRSEALGGVAIYKDLAGHDRVVVATNA